MQGYYADRWVGYMDRVEWHLNNRRVNGQVQPRKKPLLPALTGTAREQAAALQRNRKAFKRGQRWKMKSDRRPA